MQIRLAADPVPVEAICQQAQKVNLQRWKEGGDNQQGLLLPPSHFVAGNNYCHIQDKEVKMMAGVISQAWFHMLFFSPHARSLKEIIKS